MKSSVLLMGCLCALSSAAVLFARPVLAASPAGTEPALSGGRPALPAEAAGPLLLRQGVEAAWQRHPWAQALATRQTQQQADLSVAGAWVSSPPTASLGRVGDRAGTRAPRQEWEAELSVPLWWLGQRGAGRTLAERSQAQLDAEVAAQKLLVAEAVRSIWWTVLGAQDQVAVLQGRVEAAEALQQDVERRHRAGELARVDAHAASGEWLAARSELAEARQALVAAEGRWQALTGLPMAAHVPSATWPTAESEENTMDAHPALQAARLEAAVAEARVDVAAAAAREAPEVAVRVVRERRDTTEPFDNTVGVRVSVPLGSTPRTLRASAGARAEWIEADARVAQLVARLHAALTEAREALNTARMRLSLARERAELAAESERLLRKAFSLGEVDLATLLRARAGAFDADRELRRQRRALDAAQDQLQHALGRLP
jgi:cobalt-zinc-cadmium efflux system outer membrane protein